MQVTILQCAVGDKIQSLICGKVGGEGGEPGRQQSLSHSSGLIGFCVTISAPMWSQNQLACLKGWESKKTVSGFYECFFLEVWLSHTLTKCSVWLFPPSLGKSRDGVREEIRIRTSPASLRLAIVALRPECSVKMTSFGP